MRPIRSPHQPLIISHGHGFHRRASAALENLYPAPLARRECEACDRRSPDVKHEIGSNSIFSRQRVADVCDHLHWEAGGHRKLFFLEFALLFDQRRYTLVIVRDPLHDCFCLGMFEVLGEAKNFLGAETPVLWVFDISGHMCSLDLRIFLKRDCLRANSGLPAGGSSPR